MVKKSVEPVENKEVTVTPNDLEWNDYVLGLLSDDEEINGNPTTDGLRRIFEIALKCRLIASTSQVTQSPSPDNEKRATVVHSLMYRLNPESDDPNGINTLTVDGSADVYWGNCDKIYRNHPVAVAETRAEGRALRRALRLRKVVAAEELATNVEDDVMGDSVGKITSNQVSFMDVIAKRLNVNVIKLIESMNLPHDNIKNLTHDNAVSIIRELSKLQQSVDSIPDNIKTYDQNWK